MNVSQMFVIYIRKYQRLVLESADGYEALDRTKSGQAAERLTARKQLQFKSLCFLRERGM